MRLAQGFTINENFFPPAGKFQTSEGIGILATYIVLILTSIAGAIAIIFIVIAGIKLVTSSGDEKKLASATGTLTYAIIGLAVVVLAFVIIRLIQFFLGAEVPITAP